MRDQQVADKLREIATVLNGIKIPHAGFEAALDDVWEALAKSKSGKHYHILLLGPSGSGKTTVMESILLAFGRQIRDDDAYINRNTGVVAMKCPPRCTQARWLTAYLKAAGDPFPGKEFDNEGRSQLDRALSLTEISKTIVVVIDEFHHLVRNKRGKVDEKGKVVQDIIKTMLDNFPCTVVAIALNVCEQMIDAERQLGRRFTYRPYLTAIPIEVAGDDPSDPERPLASFLQGYSNEIQKQLGFVGLPDFSDGLTVLRFAASTSALPGGIRPLFEQSLCQLVRSGRELSTISFTDFQRVASRPYFKQFRLTGKDPFDMSGNALRRELSKYDLFL